MGLSVYTDVCVCVCKFTCTYYLLSSISVYHICTFLGLRNWNGMIYRATHPWKKQIFHFYL